MIKVKSPVNAIRYAVVSSLMVNLGLFLCPSSSVARPDVYGPEIRYGSCSQLQKRMNNVDNQIGIKYGGFERAELMLKTRIYNAYLVYCNGGTIIDKEEKTVCRGYIGYAYSPRLGIAQYFGTWGWTDGSPNDADGGKERYCKRLK
jgi:hypothetical protein